MPERASGAGPGTTPEPITAQALRDWPLPKPAGHKHSRGEVLVVGGARSAPGAAMLAGLAALRVGAGVLGLAVSEAVAAAVGAAVPEAGVLWLPEPVGPGAAEVLAQRLAGADAVLVGPGLDDAERTRQLLGELIPALAADASVVLDAYALGVFADLDAALQRQLAGRLVLTPNSAEAARLAGCPAEQLSLSRLADVAERYRAVISWSNSVLAPDGRSWTVPAGHAGLGTSGSGDVLAGAITGLLARGADPAQAACWATYLHASAGDRLAAPVGPLGFLAGDLLGQLPRILAELRS